MMLTQEQIAERVNYLGASEAAAAVGLSRWRTPVEVWAEKTGLVEPEDISNLLPIRMGNKLEQAAAEIFMEETGKIVYRVNETIHHPNWPFLAANLDRRVVGEDALLEIKTAGAWAAKDWEGEEMPREVIIQVMHQLAVSGKSYGYACVLIGGNQDFKWKRIERDESAITELLKKEIYFWEKFVIPKVMPATITKNDSDILFKLFPEAVPGESIPLDDKANMLIEGLEGLKQDYANLGGIIEQQKNELKAMLGTAERGESSIYKVTWKNQHKDTYTVPASDSRVLRVSKKKQEV